MDEPSDNGLPPSGASRLADIRALILTATGPLLADPGPAIEGASDDLDLRESGMIDSLGFTELVAAIEDELDLELDFEGLEPDRFTTLGPLARHVHAQTLAGREDSRED
jgi:acyl carrier protein